MRLVALVDGSPNQAALCHRLGTVGGLTGIVISRNRLRRRMTDRAQHILRRAAVRLEGDPFAKTWRALQAKYRAAHPVFPSVPRILVDNINEEATHQALERWRPDLIAVSGTNLLDSRLLAWAQRCRGIVNLHTGLSPYVRGGPNCTNWCLAQKTFHLIGNTVMWLDAGIDSGPIITSAQTPLTGREDLRELHWCVMEQAQALYLKAIQRIAEGQAVPSVPQSTLGRGQLFRSREWTASAIRAAKRNFSGEYTPETFASKTFQQLSASLILVSLDDPRRGDGGHR